jgi:hypothetical protein
MDPPLAAASFGEQDAGSGPIHASPNLGPMTAAIHNISARHLHEIATTVPDDRQFLRSWRRQLQECLAQHNGRLVRFLLTDVSGSASGIQDLNKRCAELLTKYSRPTWNFASSIRDVNLPTGLDETMAEIEREIGVGPVALRDSNRRAIRMYVSAATGLAAAETRLEEKLKRLETVVGRINEIMFMEPTTELEQLAGPTRTYLDSVLEKIDIEPDYNEVVEQYKKFAVLRPIVTLSGIQQSPAIQCKICMTKDVSQAVTPCGHTFCDDCCGRQMTACYFCRTQIRDRVRIYFS